MISSVNKLQEITRLSLTLARKHRSRANHNRQNPYYQQAAAHSIFLFPCASQTHLNSSYSETLEVRKGCGQSRVHGLALVLRSRVSSPAIYASLYQNRGLEMIHHRLQSLHPMSLLLPSHERIRCYLIPRVIGRG
jgi:hypothetical protein